MKSKHQTQVARLVAHLRRRWYSWGELLALGISNSPWARLISENGLERHLRPHERFERRLRRDGLCEMKIIKATRWTA